MSEAEQHAAELLRSLGVDPLPVLLKAIMEVPGTSAWSRNWASSPAPTRKQQQLDELRKQKTGNYGNRNAAAKPLEEALEQVTMRIKQRVLVGKPGVYLELHEGEAWYRLRKGAGRNEAWAWFEPERTTDLAQAIKARERFVSDPLGYSPLESEQAQEQAEAELGHAVTEFNDLIKEHT